MNIDFSIEKLRRIVIKRYFSDKIEHHEKQYNVDIKDLKGKIKKLKFHRMIAIISTLFFSISLLTELIFVNIKDISPALFLFNTVMALISFGSLAGNQAGITTLAGKREDARLRLDNIFSLVNNNADKVELLKEAIKGTPLSINDLVGFNHILKEIKDVIGEEKFNQTLFIIREKTNETPGHAYFLYEFLNYVAQMPLIKDKVEDPIITQMSGIMNYGKNKCYC